MFYSENMEERDHFGDLGANRGKNIKIDHAVMCVGTDCMHLPRDKSPAVIIRMGSTHFKISLAHPVVTGENCPQRKLLGIKPFYC
jgi:hypothetical protein